MNLQIDHLQKSFSEKSVLKDASFTFEKGKIYGLLGRNGAGKTTLFNCISGELKAESGSIKMLADDMTPVACDVGYVYATPVLPDFLTGYEFVRFYLDINRDKISHSKTVEEYLTMVGLDQDDWYRLIKGYSHGMKNKLQMLCVLMAQPPVVLLDEPLTSFDVVAAHQMKELLREMKVGHILILSTHILQIASDICDEIVVLNDGLLQGVGEEIMHAPDFEEQVIRLLGGDADA
ncbi:MAG: ABC transporter ATP-binding protein [Clostridiales bacterium]|nr:ABC transporter ATP-binding protein [Clostridiales bacterium]